MSEFGIGASVLRKEDDRFLKGRGQYVGDYRLPGTREVAFVRSPIAHGRLKSIRIPKEFRDCVYTADHLNNVKPIVSAPPLKGFKYSVQPVLATGKVRYVGEMIAMCVASSRAEAEDIADAIAVELEELPAVTDMIAATRPNSPLVHEEWGDNIFVEFVREWTDRGCCQDSGNQGQQVHSDGPPLHVSNGRTRGDRVSRRAAATPHLDHLDAVPAFSANRPVRMPRPRARQRSCHLPRCWRRVWIQGVIVPGRSGSLLAGYAGRLSRSVAGRLPGASLSKCQLPRASLRDHRICDRGR